MWRKIDKNVTRYRQPRPAAISERVVKTSSQMINGEETIVGSVVDVPLSEIKKTLPAVEDMKLENLLKAGVPLDVINTASLLNPLDPESAISAAQGAVDAALNYLVKNSTVEKSVDVESSKSE